MFKTYYQLTKPGIVYGNAITTIGGFLLASKGSIHVGLFLAALVGISLVIASACVFNNYIDKDIDGLMERTKNRALITGQISGQNAIMFATILGLLGFGLLILFTNLLTALIAFVGFFVYVVLYGKLKRSSVHGTLVGAISGAVPIVVGYTAVTNRFDWGASILFAILFLWQMPHFYAIAMYRLNDYSTAHIPVLPVKKGAYLTKVHILLYVITFTAAISMLTVFKYAGYSYLVVMGLLSLTWLWFATKGFNSKNEDSRWARKMFLFSLVIILFLCVTVSIDALLPKL